MIEPTEENVRKASVIADFLNRINCFSRNFFDADEVMKKCRNEHELYWWYQKILKAEGKLKQMTKEEQKQRAKERYEWLKSHKICTICGNEKAVEGLTLCEVCRKKSYDRINSCRKNATPENRQKRLAYAREYAKRKRAEYSAKGLCVRCGRKPPKENCTRCEICLEVVRKDTAKRSKKQR